jgi:glutamate-5-semialdehyde dehydrogenase
MNSDVAGVEKVDSLEVGQRILCGNRWVRVSQDLADAFEPGDRLIALQESGELLRITSSDQQLAHEAVSNASHAFTLLSEVSDEQISLFYKKFATFLQDDDLFRYVQVANDQDVEKALEKGRSVTRLRIDAKMRSDMVEGLLMWSRLELARDLVMNTVEHDGWDVEVVRSPLGVVGFVFEGRPNVFADATGVLRTGNTVVFRIGSDALGTARAISQHMLAPALGAAGLPEKAVVLIDSPTHGAGWALFAHIGLSLAIARGSGKAVAQLGAVARQSGIAVSLHGTGGAWMILGDSADADEVTSHVLYSLDRKVCNTLNVVAMNNGTSAQNIQAVLNGISASATQRGTQAIVHVSKASQYLFGSCVIPDNLDIRWEDNIDYSHEYEWENVPELALYFGSDIHECVETFNAHSPQFVVSCLSQDQNDHDLVWRKCNAPFVGNGFTRWVDGQYALKRPELGLSNWQGGRLLGRGGVLSGDGVHTIRLRAKQTDHDVHR